jgi:hypothetical protein
MTTPTTAHYQVALEYASKDFDEADPVRRAFVSIVKYLVENRTKNIRHLTFGMLREAAQLNPDEGEILHRTIAYLTGARANLLTVGYEFIDEDFEYELSVDDIQEFLIRGEVCDPRSGLEVAESANSIYVFFRPNYAAFH